MAFGRFDNALGTHVDDASGTAWAPGVGWVRGDYLYTKGGRPVQISTLPQPAQQVARTYSQRAANLNPAGTPPPQPPAPTPAPVTSGPATAMNTVQPQRTMPQPQATVGSMRSPRDLLSLLGGA